MHIPETAVNKYDFTMSGQNYIRMAGKVFTMKSVVFPMRLGSTWKIEKFLAGMALIPDNLGSRSFTYVIIYLELRENAK